MTLGIGVIGAWSLCLALGAVSTLADLGASEGMARTVAQRAVGPDRDGLRQVLVTGLASCGAGCLAGALVSCDRALPVARLLTDPAALATTLSVLAPALLVACVNAIGLSCQAVLDGL